MREILFRGKRLDNDEWVEGFYNHTPCDKFGVDEHLIQTILENGRIGMWHDIDPYTVGQYTGLKDKNGTLIFEGDIVRCGTGRICKVTFFTSPSFSGFDLVPIGGFDAPAPHKWSLFSDTEVIGNITDNPELLEK